MITKEIRNNYKSLIEEANSLLKLTNTADVLTNLDDYFQVLGDLSQKVKNKEIDPKFLILPNDEGWFEIDANSRKINIPSRFTSYGAGVQGDEVAEIIYFSIDRYFDVHDLYEKEILVQWENAATKPDKGLSVTINKSLQMLPNKVVFGWPLTKEITKYPGKVKFSVRFFDRKEATPEDPSEYLLYSFSTLNAEIKINSGLDFNIDKVENIDKIKIDKNNRIYDHIRNSVEANPLWPAKPPIFEGDFPEMVNLVKDEETGEWYYILTANVYYDENDDENHGVGVTTYEWSYKDKNGVDHVKADNPQYILTTDAKPQNDTYYIKKDDGTFEIKNVIPGEAFPPVNPETGEKYELYEQIAGFKAVEPGLYKVTATNTYGRGNSRSTVSPICEIPVAKAATFTFADDTDKHYVLTKNIDNILIDVVTPDGGELDVDWVRNVRDSVDGAEDYPGTVDVQNGNILSAELEVPMDADVWYFLKAVNKKNNDTIVSYSNSIRVTMPAVKISDVVYKVNSMLKVPEYNSIDVRWSGSGSVLLTVEPDITGIAYDEFRYEWLKKEFQGDTDIVVWVPAPGATNENTYAPSAEGDYQCAIYTIYNTDESEPFESATFDVK